MTQTLRTARYTTALALLASGAGGWGGAPALASGLPSPANALTVADVTGVLERGITRARQLGANATISVIDSEGNILGVVRMTNAALRPDPGTSTVGGGGTGGLEGVVVPSAVTATTKAGTGAFLSTSIGNAFTTRTAGFIIQERFPPGIQYQDSGPLFGVQFSSLPTSDLVRLPLGMSADPGGIPLYKGGQIVGGVGVELDGTYTVDRTPRIVNLVPEEMIAQAAQMGFAAPVSITADQIMVDGLRLVYQNGRTPAPGSLGFISPLSMELGAGRATALIAPRVGPTVSKFSGALVGSINGQTLRNLTAARYEAVASGPGASGGALYAVRALSDLSREIVRIGVPSGIPAFVAVITGAAPARMTIDDSVSALAYDDNLTPATADDRLVVFTGSGRVFTVALTGGAISPLVTLATPSARPRDALSFAEGTSQRILALSDVTGQAFKITVATAGTAAGIVALTTPADGRLQSIAVGAGGLLYAIREAPAPAPAGTRDLVRIAPTGGVTLVQRLTDGGANEPGAGQNLFALACDDNGTPATADDRLVVQNSTLARQFRVSPTTGAIAAAAVVLPERRGVLRQGRLLRAGGFPYLVGINKQDRLLFSIRADAPAPLANTVELTPAEPLGFARTGVASGPPTNLQRLTPADVNTALTRAHELNSLLRAMIRRDRPQISQVNVSVVDAQGNLLGFFRTNDAPVFGADVSLQKARSAMFFSRPDCGTTLAAAEGARFAPFANACAAIGYALNGSIAHSERSIGFVSRPFIPDGIPLTAPGPLSIRPPDRFSVFNTGLQTQLLLTNLVTFLTEFASVGNEGLALDLFNSGVIGGGGVSDRSLPLANGLQIFPGGVPLYKNGVLVGGIGVSGDGIEQDDFVAYAGSEGLRAFGAARTSDQAGINLNGRLIRLPYIKLPRNPFAGR